MILHSTVVDIGMIMPASVRTDARRALMWGLMLAILWVGVAIFSPTTTFHLAPLLIAAAPPVLLVLDEGASADRGPVLRVGAISSALSLGTALLLLSIGMMEGPVFEAFPTPLVEAIAFTAIGAIAGTWFGWWRTR